MFLGHICYMLDGVLNPYCLSSLHDNKEEPNHIILILTRQFLISQKLVGDYRLILEKRIRLLIMLIFMIFKVKMRVGRLR